ncbi:hypothetical protein R1flu_024556 [Riccia fluitans]|uniref:Uncharacterized protein n=1 Tax=Riccia fluitans TaxID=41844 RepID=A0ABD1XV97_9MARC
MSLRRVPIGSSSSDGSNPGIGASSCAPSACGGGSSTGVPSSEAVPESCLIAPRLLAPVWPRPLCQAPEKPGRTASVASTVGFLLPRPRTNPGPVSFLAEVVLGPAGVRS